MFILHISHTVDGSEIRPSAPGMSNPFKPLFGCKKPVVNHGISTTNKKNCWNIISFGPMYGIFPYIYHKNQPTVGEYYQSEKINPDPKAEHFSWTLGAGDLGGLRASFLGNRAKLLKKWYPPGNLTYGWWNIHHLAILLVTFSGWFFVTLLERLSDLQLGDEKVTNWITWHLSRCISYFLFKMGIFQPAMFVYRRVLLMATRRSARKPVEALVVEIPLFTTVFF